jgi:hypothetical protein
MAPIRPNWSDARGRVVSIEPADHDYVRLQLALDAADDVADYPNLLHDRVGEELPVEMPGDVARAAGLAAGDRIAARLRLGAIDLAFADPAMVRRTTD